MQTSSRAAAESRGVGGKAGSAGELWCREQRHDAPLPQSPAPVAMQRGPPPRHSPREPDAESASRSQCCTRETWFELQPPSAREQAVCPCDPRSGERRGSRRLSRGEEARGRRTLRCCRGTPSERERWRSGARGRGERSCRRMRRTGSLLRNFIASGATANRAARNAAMISRQPLIALLQLPFELHHPCRAGEGRGEP
jgi:hypothetical protein